jgi:hypothetical protein
MQLLTLPEVHPLLSLRELALALVYAERRGNDRLYQTLLRVSGRTIVRRAPTGALTMGVSRFIINLHLPSSTLVLPELIFDWELGIICARA